MLDYLNTLLFDIELNKYNESKTIFIAFVISLGGFLFGFDAGIISGVVSYAVPEYNLNDVQTGWLVSSPSFTAMIAMLISGRLSDRLEEEDTNRCCLSLCLIGYFISLGYFLYYALCSSNDWWCRLCTALILAQCIYVRNLYSRTPRKAGFHSTAQYRLGFCRFFE